MIHFIKKSLIAVSISLAAAFYANALDLPTTLVNGKDYFYYDVQPKETIFSISKKLGVSREEIIHYNPAVEEGLKAYTRLYFPVEAYTSSNNINSASHTVKKGETLYGIAKKYGVSVDRIIALNPSARDGIKVGDILSISSEDNNQSQPVMETKNSRSHTIAQGETLYRIAKNNGITVEQLLAANPSLDSNNYEIGTVITIPAGTYSIFNSEDVTEVDVNLQPINNSNIESTPEEENVNNIIADNSQPDNEIVEEQPQSAPVSVYNDNNSPFTIAVMLPFKLDAEKQDRESENFTEFYRGFLLAAQNLSNSGRSVNIKAFDTRGDIETVKQLMERNEMNDVDMFVTPASTAELEYIISHIDSTRQYVFNNFSVRNKAHQSMPNVLQANIPHDKLYQRAIDAFMTEMKGRTPIFIKHIGATADKEEFTSMLKTKLSENAVDYKEIIFEHTLSEEDFTSFSTDSSYVIVPLSSSSSEFNKIAPQAKQFKATLSSPNGLVIFGFPEWLTFRGERKESLCELNATIYSRFYFDENNSLARKVVDAYKMAFGREMNSAVPSQAIMGYDVATFIIKSMHKNNGNFHSELKPFDGLQSDYIFSDSESKGLVNTAVEIIKFREDGVIEHYNF